MYNLGAEGRTISKTLSVEVMSTYVRDGDNGDSAVIDEYASLVKTLDKRFNPKKNVVLERHKFLQRAQLPGESIDDFVAALRTLAISCNYREFRDEIIRDLIERTSDKKIQEKLLATDDPDLETALTLAKSIEHSQFCMREMSSSSQSPEVKSLSSKKIPKSTKFSNVSRARDASPKLKSEKSQPFCYRCGSKNHLGNAKFCYALEQTCFKCGEKGHLARLCKVMAPSKSNAQVVKSIEEDPFDPSDEEDQLLMLSSSSVQSEGVMEIASMGSAHKRKSPSCVIDVNGKKVKFLADSGSPFTLVNIKDFGNIDKVQLQPSNIRIFAYGGKRVEVLGRYSATLEFQGESATGTVFFVEDGANLLGWEEQGGLGIILDPNHPDMVLSRHEAHKFYAPPSSVLHHLSSDDWFHQYPEVFTDRLGKLKGFQHRIILKKDACAVAHKVPLSLRSELKQELERLSSMDVIEPIKGSEWLAPVVLACKPDKSLRMCVDLRDLNANIWIDRQPLPNINEMLSTLEGAKYFSSFDILSAYHQVELSRDSRHLTSFVTPEGALRYKRMPFGLASASAVFQRLMG